MVYQAAHPSQFQRLHTKGSYDVDGVRVYRDENGTVLSYVNDGNIIVERLDGGGPAEGNGEVIDKQNSLHYWYNKPLRSWVIVHNHLAGAEDDEDGGDSGVITDTLFVRDSGRVILRRGYVPSMSPYGFLEGLFFVGVALLALLAFYAKAM